jgi:mannose-6-phosphate isomerase-like protein (cupin superfamily)
MVHESPGLELGVYVLVAPKPDGQTPHAHDEVYVVLDGETDIAVDGEVRHLAQGDAVFVAARAEHRFSGYDVVSLLVIFNGPHSASKRDGQTS